MTHMTNEEFANWARKSDRQAKHELKQVQRWLEQSERANASATAEIIRLRQGLEEVLMLANNVDVVPLDCVVQYQWFVDEIMRVAGESLDSAGK
jgi:hypothetical protein